MFKAPSVHFHSGQVLMPFSHGMTRETLRVTERWDHFSLFLRPRGNGFCGMCSQDPVGDRIGAESLTSFAKSRITSTSLPRLSMFTIESPNITFANWRETGSYPRLARNMASSTFSHLRWRHISISSTRYGVKYDPRKEV